ncbi:tRNA uridine-5-carboxymethylaminomethyl(34) synthesis GTPase MnmE [Desulfosudis oleivorans]|uniref:tRNA modification GTPase MnmE n=1 Tax=Desulfosudis oleivorans (strain DSM 6200 / JCM 39069 / Hxd3) TaxID=96561 RepID=A8ZSK1_DESOH|nr:tRNA uridine-5-carboxymethylaminomethyl(34) synthesis GTPase MnmE [Desulfosudis oleivorans]ABW65914.1 tRNA modification GTPase TrmE [Desulfosudis oleivorans Hxd3]
MERSTIAAIATPAAPGGIGIVRLSGPRAVAIALSVFSSRPDAAAASLSEAGAESHRMYHGYVFDDDALVDEVLLVVMRAPRSYTGEDVAEIHTHGGPAVVSAVCDLVLRAGAEPAAPGEFTQRAFLNGRIDLTQAEAVADMIEAASIEQVKAAAAQVSGEIRQAVSGLKQSLAGLMAEMEAAIEFDDQVEGSFSPEKAACRIETEVLPCLQDLLDRRRATEAGRGATVVIAGPPNAGKSTLLNRLLGTDRALVSEIPGTTRDLVDGRVWVSGTPFVFTDTAGLRPDSGDAVEAMGMARARTAMDQADLILFVVDAAAGMGPESGALFCEASAKPFVVVANKSDLPEARGFMPPSAWPAAPVVHVSALHGLGIKELKNLLVRMVGEQAVPASGRAAPNPRHRAALVACREALVAAGAALKNGVPADVAVLDIRAAVDRLNEISGEGAGPTVLDAIFERFCIGK